MSVSKLVFVAHLMDNNYNLPMVKICRLLRGNPNANYANSTYPTIRCLDTAMEAQTSRRPKATWLYTLTGNLCPISNSYTMPSRFYSQYTK